MGCAACKNITDPEIRIGFVKPDDVAPPEVMTAKRMRSREPGWLTKYQFQTSACDNSVRGR